jgi:P27 family predicted phage terminase small subunit
VGIAGRKPDIVATRTDPDRTPARQTGDIVAMDPPEDLTDTAAEIWRGLLPDLLAAKVFRVSDAFLLSELCSVMAMAREFRADVERLQEMEVNEDDYESQSDYFDALERVDAMLKRARTGYRQMMQTTMSIAGEFGISPVSRLRLGLMSATKERLSDLLD